MINNNSNNATDDNNNRSDSDNYDNNDDIKNVSDINLFLKGNKILLKGVRRSLPKIITNLVSMLAVKKRREVQNLTPRLMILPVRTLKRQMQKRQCSY